MEEIIKLFKYNKNYYENKIKKTFPDSELITHGKREVVIYPAGKKTESLVESLTKNGIKIVAVGDSNKKLWGKQIGKFKIFSPTELAQKYSNLPIIVSSTDYRKEITELLKKIGFKLIYPISFLNFVNSNIFVVYPEYAQRFNALFSSINQSDIIKLNNLWDDVESKKTFLKVLKFHISFNDAVFKSKIDYHENCFDTKILSFSKKEVFVDCGAYIGDTIEQFNLITSGKFKKIYAFEPDKNNFNQLSKKCKEIDKTKIFCILGGVYNFTGEVNFMETGDPIARIIDSKQSVPINVLSIDDFMKDKEAPTFIKMDIEGSETEALLGAKKVIEKHKPKLAISVYHNATDLWKIPLLIKSLNNDYKIYLRHDSNEIMDTICYAV